MCSSAPKYSHPACLPKLSALTARDTPPPTRTKYRAFKDWVPSWIFFTFNASEASFYVLFWTLYLLFDQRRRAAERESVEGIVPRRVRGECAPTLPGRRALPMEMWCRFPKVNDNREGRWGGWLDDEPTPRQTDRNANHFREQKKPVKKPQSKKHVNLITLLAQATLFTCFWKKPLC